MKHKFLIAAALAVVVGAGTAFAADDHHGTGGGGHGGSGGGSGGGHGGSGHGGSVGGAGIIVPGGGGSGHGGSGHGGSGHGGSSISGAGIIVPGSGSGHGGFGHGGSGHGGSGHGGSGHGGSGGSSIIFGIGGHGFKSGTQWGHSRHNSAFDQLRRVVTAGRHFHHGSYHRPNGWYYRRWNYGDFLPALFFGQSYWLEDYDDFDLPYPPPGTVWVRYGNDSLLVDEDTGEIIQVVYGIFY